MSAVTPATALRIEDVRVAARELGTLPPEDGDDQVRVACGNIEHLPQGRTVLARRHPKGHAAVEWEPTCGCTVEDIAVYYAHLAAEADEMRTMENSAGSTNGSSSAAGPGDTSPTSLSSQPDWPEPMAAEAYHGIAGEVVRIIEPHSEADPHAILLQFVIGVGTAIGRGAGFEAESTFHGGNEYGLIVGVTAGGRKGSSYRQAMRPLDLTDATFAERRVSGVSSGEGVIAAVRDPVEARRKAKSKAEREEADEDGYVTEVVDEGEPDKRALLHESEFASVLRVSRREGSTTGTVLRQAWESGHLRTLTKNSPLKATGAHVSLIGHVTADELRRETSANDAANGTLNRFLYVMSRRSKQLPEGGALTDGDFAEIVPRLRDALRHGSTCGVLPRDDAARRRWAEVYGPLSDGRPGLLGAVTSRAEAHVMRLAVIYAVLDCSPEIRVEHLEAALAVWRYCADSAAYVFGEALGDPTADEILVQLRQRSDGMRRSEIVDHFDRHKSAAELDRAISGLTGRGLIESRREGTGGRPAIRYLARREQSEVSDGTLPPGGDASHNSHISQGGGPDDG